jgi:hypothetical protein
MPENMTKYPSSIDIKKVLTLVASITDQEFLHSNAGRTIDEEGCISLFRPDASIDGLVSAQLGTLDLESGEEMTFSICTDNLYSVAVDASAVAGIIQKNGMLVVSPGKVVMPASTAGDLLGTVVNCGGLVSANAIVKRNGTFVLTASSSGDVQVKDTDSFVTTDSAVSYYEN